jgi:hypothetical protein
MVFSWAGCHGCGATERYVLLTLVRYFSVIAALLPTNFWFVMQLNYTQQTMRSYTDFCMQINFLTDRDIVWTSYTTNAIAACTTQGLSSVCSETSTTG